MAASGAACWGRRTITGRLQGTDMWQQDCVLVFVLEGLWGVRPPCNLQKKGCQSHMGRAACGMMKKDAHGLAGSRNVLALHQHPCLWRHVHMAVQSSVARQVGIGTHISTEQHVFLGSVPVGQPAVAGVGCVGELHFSGSRCLLSLRRGSQQQACSSTCCSSVPAVVREGARLCFFPFVSEGFPKQCGVLHVGMMKKGCTWAAWAARLRESPCTAPRHAAHHSGQHLFNEVLQGKLGSVHIYHCTACLPERCAS